jgi:hypothetical protein
MREEIARRPAFDADVDAHWPFGNIEYQLAHDRSHQTRADARQSASARLNGPRDTILRTAHQALRNSSQTCDASAKRR